MPGWIDSNILSLTSSSPTCFTSDRYHRGGAVPKCIETVLLACVFIAARCFLMVTDCLAADVAFPNPISNYDWSGFYVGGHVGYGRGYERNILSDPNPTAGSSFGSLFGGLQVGYNYLLPSRLLLGIEGDISFPN